MLERRRPMSFTFIFAVREDQFIASLRICAQQIAVFMQIADRFVPLLVSEHDHDSTEGHEVEGPHHDDHVEDHEEQSEAMEDGSSVFHPTTPFANMRSRITSSCE